MYVICISPTKYGLKFIQMSCLVGFSCSYLKRLKSLEITRMRAGGLSPPWEMLWIVSNPQRTPANTCTRTTYLLLEVKTVSSGTAASRKSDVNTADWWGTVKLHFVKEKQEASCGRPSLRGWEETAGRKPHVQICKLQVHSLLSPSIRLALWPTNSPSSFHRHYNSHMCESYHLEFWVCCFSSV